MDFQKKDHTTTVSLGEIKLSDPDKFSNINPKDVAVLPTRSLVLFPGITLPISLGRSNSLTTARLSNERKIPIAILCQRNPDTEHPAIPTDFFEFGVIAEVLKIIDLPDGSQTAIVHAHERFELVGEGMGLSIPEAKISASVELLKEGKPRSNDKEFPQIVQNVKEMTLDILDSTSGAPEDFIFNLRNSEDHSTIINLVATQLPAKPETKIRLLRQHKLKDRALMLLSELAVAREFSKIQQTIFERTQANISEQQRTNFLQHQMDTIRQELNGDMDDADKMMQRASETVFPTEVRPIFDRELEKLRRLNPQSPDYSVQYTYLDTVLSLPWGKYDVENNDFGKARSSLDNDHYGLEKVKERILEQIAVLMNYPEGKAPILCLVGPPGVGKTSLGQSVAKAMGRKYQRVSLGGLHDEAEVRGHRRTYIGAMPGRIIDAVKRAGSSNPVIVLDEIDKIGADFKGDPSAALLEVLDPEQNCHFHDNYIDIDFDLSKVLFIATANTLSSLSQPLLDRMEVIDLSGYIIEEKIEIARRHLIPKLLKEHNIEPGAIDIQPEAIEKIIESYTSESGVRQLEKSLAKIIRKIVLKKMSGETPPTVIPQESLTEFLGTPKYNRERYEGNDIAGVVTGLAWTSVGGEILYIETSLSEGKGDKLVLTGNLGNVMKESAMIALEYVKAHAAMFGLDTSLFDKYNIHIHVPEGAIPKDGPSVGITMVTSLISALKQCKVKPRIAMTGEITLRGKVLPVGGLKEKILAAKRAGITEIIVSSDNKKDVEDIEEIYRRGLTFKYVSTIPEVIDNALTDETPVTAKTL